MIRIVFIGCIEFSNALLGKVLTLSEAEVVGVVTRESSSFNSDFRSLKPLADGAEIPCFLDTGNRQGEMADWMKPLGKTEATKRKQKKLEDGLKQMGETLKKVHKTEKKAFKQQQKALGGGY